MLTDTNIKIDVHVMFNDGVQNAIGTDINIHTNMIINVNVNVNASGHLNVTAERISILISVLNIIRIYALASQQLFLVKIKVNQSLLGRPNIHSMEMVK